MEIIIGILLSMLFSALFSGVEMAFVSADKMRLELSNPEGTLTGKILSRFYRNKNNFISTLLVGNNIALVVYGVCMAHLIGELWLSKVTNNEVLILVIQTFLSTLIILFTGEFLPKTFFKLQPNRLLALFAAPIYLCYLILYPISRFTSSLSTLLLKMGGIKASKETQEKAFSKIDLDHFIQSSLGSTPNDEELEPEVRIFQNALDFTQTKVRDCAIPRTEIVAVPLTVDVETLKGKFVETGFSKILVFDQNIDTILGYIHSSEMFRHPNDWQKQIQQIPFVPESMNASKMLKLFMAQKKSLAVVVDEFGGTAGIISLEDLVEEIFGDIQDEHDTNQYIANELGNGEYLLSGRLEVEKANELFGLNLPESDDYITISGLILQRYQNFPKLHEIIDIEPFQFKIVKVTATKIELVRLKVSK
ncbi:MAG: HlyC/CorC family transporter [Bacteroidaceae bacterium]|nr:HlyC/CorC family transporter [Bacteroidaceae bacterium]MBP9636909.1 HlyC/CorC family transporter [Bacteroidaceae bacterium]